MSRFKIWLEVLEAEKEKKIKDIWGDIFKSLSGGQDPVDTVRKSLEEVTHKYRRPGSTTGSAVLGLLKPFFARLQQIDPQLAGNIQEVESWLGQPQEAQGGTTPKKKTVEDLMRKLFGEKFDNLLHQEPTSSDEPQAQAQVPPQAPDAAPGGMNLAAPSPAPPAAGPPGQPQVPPAPQMMPQPQIPMPPLPAGAQIGMY